MVHHSFPAELSVLRTVVEKEKADIYLVGGFWRDIAAGREHERHSVQDLDFAVSRGAIKVARTFARKIRGAFVLLDKENGCGRVVKKTAAGSWIYDFTDFRAPTMAKDLTHRDFTVNTIAVPLSHLNGGRVPDGLPAGALSHRRARSDIKARRIRMASACAFDEDPLRLLRAYSLSAQLNFRIEAQTLALIKRKASLIRRVSPERVREELFKILESPRAAATIRAMDAVGLLTAVIPQFEVMRNVEQGGYHHLDVWKHTLATLTELESLVAGISRVGELREYLNEEIGGGHRRIAVLKLAALLHDIGKPDTKKIEGNGRVSFHGHEHIGRRITRIVSRQLMLSTKERFVVEDIVSLHLRPGYLSNFKKPSDRMIFRFMRDAGDEAAAILLLAISDQRATRGMLTTSGDVRHLEKICFSLIKFYFEKKNAKPFVRLINGNDLIRRLKLEPGPLFAKVLSAVDEAQHLEKIKTREEALAFAGRWAALHGKRPHKTITKRQPHLAR